MACGGGNGGAQRNENGGGASESSSWRKYQRRNENGEENINGSGNGENPWRRSWRGASEMAGIKSGAAKQRGGSGGVWQKAAISMKAAISVWRNCRRKRRNDESESGVSMCIGGIGGKIAAASKSSIIGENGWRSKSAAGGGIRQPFSKSQQ